MLLGSSRRLVPSLFVQYPASAKPSSFGTFPSEPTAITRSPASSSRTPSLVWTRSCRGPVSFAVPRIGTMPTDW